MNKIIIVAALAAAGLSAAPALAQDAAHATSGVYGNLGYSRIDGGSNLNLDAAQARVGAHIGSYFGVEGEGAIGLGSDRTRVGATSVRTKLSHEVAGYAVAMYPVMPNFDVFARVGYGNTRINVRTPTTETHVSQDSINYGAGAQYFFTGADGVRAEYTRNDYRHDSGHANVWSVSYVRRF